MEHINRNATGAVVYWTCGPTDREKLKENLDSLCLQGVVPAERTDAAALKMAVTEYQAGTLKGKSRKKSKDCDTIVQPHKDRKKNGFEVVDVERGEDQNFYTPDFSVRVDRDGERVKIVVSRGYADNSNLQRLFEQHKAQLGGSAVGKCLSDVVERLAGVALRPSGGVYWIPDASTELWTEVALAVEGAASEKGGSSVYMMRTVIDACTVRAVKDAIVGEVTTAASLLAEEISGGLGEEALETRQRVAKRLHEKVRQYEEIIGEAMQGLHAVIETVEQSAMILALQA